MGCKLPENVAKKNKGDEGAGITECIHLKECFCTSRARKKVIDALENSKSYNADNVHNKN